MVMGFKNESEKNERNISVPKEFTNAIIYGRTGSGKTTGAILPIIEDRIKSNYGLFIYDFKGNLHKQVKYLANKFDCLDKVIEIGKPWGKKINLLDYLTIKQSRYVVIDSDGVTNSNYWNNASRFLLEDVYVVLKTYYKIKSIIDDKNYRFKDISYKTIFENISTPEKVSNFYSKYRSEYLPSIKSYIKSMIQTDDITSKYSEIDRLSQILESSLNNLAMFENVIFNSDSGKNATVQHLSSFVSNIASKDYLNNGEMDVERELRSGKIIIIDVSSLNENVIDIINLGVYSRLQSFRDKNDKPVCIVADEAQKILSKDYLPQTDVCREYKFEYIFATQDTSLLINKLGFMKFEELSSNIVTNLSFAGKNNEISEKNRYINLSTNKTYLAKPIYIDEQELLKVEHKFQKMNDIFKFADFSSKAIYCLKFDAKLHEDCKVLVELKDKTIEQDFIDPFYFEQMRMRKASGYYDKKDCKIENSTSDEDEDLLKPILSKNSDKTEIKQIKTTIGQLSRGLAASLEVSKKHDKEIKKLKNIIAELESKIDSMENQLW